MTQRIETVRKYVDGIFDHSPVVDDRKIAYIHSYGVASLASVIAGKRGLNCELAFIIGLLHDIYSYRTGITWNHPHNGAEMARPAIRDMGIFSDDEQIIVLSAIFHHSDKPHVHDEYDELIKDADLLKHYTINPSRVIPHPAVLKRLRNVMNELGMSEVDIPHDFTPKVQRIIQQSRTLLADVAEALARKEIRGERTSPEFMELVRYFPEDSAYDELVNAWCAAFVYHCCIQTGFLLPIRPPHTSCRLAGVGAWYEWGKDNGFCFTIEEGFVPEKGDIVIYNHIIPPERKPENLPWHDHIGIVLGRESDCLFVAEGNINNQNVSGIIERDIDETIGCFVRIPDDYVYDGEKYDYKTGEIRVIDL